MAPATKRSDTNSESQHAAELVEWLVSPETREDPEGPPQSEAVDAPEKLDPAYAEVLRATRQCVLYGTGGFAVLCILVGAVEALFGR